MGEFIFKMPCVAFFYYYNIFFRRVSTFWASEREKREYREKKREGTENEISKKKLLNVVTFP